MNVIKRRGRPSKNKVEEIIEEAEIIDMENNEPIVDNNEDNQQFEAGNESIIDSQPKNEGTFGNYNPLADNVVERDYSTPKTAQNLTEDIPEPSFEQDLSFDDLMKEPASESEEEPKSFSSAFDNPNPALNDLPPQEKQIACESMVDTVLDVYAGLHKLAGNYAKFPEEKLNELILNNEIDGDMMMPTESGEDVSLQEFFGSYNEQVDEIFTYDREFGMKVRPAMVRVFMKKGWGMTDEQLLLFAFGQDIITKATQFYGLKKSINSTVDLLKEIHSDSKTSIPTEKKQPKKEVFNAQPIQVEQDFQDDEIIIDDETIIGQGLNNDEDFVQTEKMNIHKFKRPQETKHPDLVQKEMDKLNEEAKRNKK
jgi:hypothetical protein